ncbi:import component protein [Siphonobacter aquaeclarae]|uniref:Import component protein n=1 Tax=Siphonobacter aquaeclarae TaxID=563176 RepID=A0A1G9UI91_9BACT|nr:import component protein [Siphonobacter aquaeclarae]SDM59632.1 hypothetical protein SAMN04488090_3830 [Siphonobacter aquaeclarae]
MNNKSLSILSYITLIGWLIAYFTGKDQANDLLKYHLRQSLGLLIAGLLLSIGLNILMAITSLYSLGYLSLVVLVLLIIGAINAANEVKKPLPIIGKMFENKFSFIG